MNNRSRSTSRISYRIAKRMLDVVIASAFAIVTLPILAVVAGLIRWCLGSPVLFRQERAGQYGQPFELVKFRTMRNAHDDEGHLLSDAERLTEFGQRLRRLSLDEFPQMWNVIRGDMSLVGPRPLLVHYLGLYTPAQMRRHDVPPGITGWAQVNGRNAISWEDKFQLDLWYVQHASLWLDLKIMWLTVIAALVPRGVSADKHPTMPEFTGSAPKSDRSS